MEFCLQFGYGMMGHTRCLLELWDGGAVILSPRDLTPGQLQRFATEILDLGGSVLLDPQFYLPDADHHRLQSHEYWPDQYVSADFWDGGACTEMLQKLAHLNDSLGADPIVLPGIHTAVASETWLQRQELVQLTMRRLVGDRALYATVALSDDFLRSEDQVSGLLRAADDWDVQGIYLLAEHPETQYLVSDPLWLTHLLDVIAGFRLRGLAVLTGYANQQLLITACASPTGLASGTWQNVRSFPPNKFIEDTQVRRRSTWYYSPNALSEYQMPYLDLAYEQGLLSELASPSGMGGGYGRILFSGPQPTSVDFREPAAFRHFLLCIREQVIQARQDSFDETLRATRAVLDEAARITDRLRRQGVMGLSREFTLEVYTACLSALTVLETNRGPLLRRHWSELN